MTRTQAQEALSTLHSTPRERVTAADQAAAVVRLSQIALHMMTKFADTVDVYGYQMDNVAPAKEADSPLFPNQSRAILMLMAPYHDGSNLRVNVETATFWREPVQPNASDNAIAATAHEVSLVSGSEQLRYRIVAEGSHQRVVRSLIGPAHSGQPATRTIGESQRIGRGDQVVSEAEVQQLWKVLNRAESLDVLDANRSNL